MERRYFTNGVRTDFAYTPAEAVKFVHDGWRECEAPSADPDDKSANKRSSKSKPTGDDGTDDRKDELPNGTTDD